MGALAPYGCSNGGPGTSNTGGSGATAGGAGTTASGASASGNAASAGATTGAAASGAGVGAGATSGAATGMAASGASGTGSAQGGSGMTGDGGSTGSADASGGGRPSGPSAGCKAAPPAEGSQVAVQHNLVVTVAPKYVPAYVNRKYFTTLPLSWDPTKPYPMIFYGQGCGQTGSEGGPFTTGHFLSDVLYVQLIPATVTGQTVVPSNGSPGCFQAGKQGLADSPDGPYFDQVLAEIEAKYCVDTGKAYVAGSSSGAWLSNYLVCARGNVIRGAAADSGGLQHDHGTCTGGAAVMEMPGDSASSVVAGFDIGVAPARDTFIATNGCSMTPTNMTFGKAACQLYGGSMSPVAYCNVGGGHQSGVPFIADAAWAFWNSLP